MNLKQFRWAVLTAFLLAAVWSFLAPYNVYAHAVMTRAVPEPNSQISEPPGRIELSFNERLEAELHYIKIYDEIGRVISKSKAVLSADQKSMSLETPELSKGRYTVTYHVISADGHPVEGTYILSIGQGAEGAIVGGSESLHAGHELSAADMTTYDVLKYVSRIAYFFGLLALAGWLMWGAAVRRDRSPAVEQYYQNGLLGLQRTHFLALISFIYFHYQDLLGDQGLGQLYGLFAGTWVGRSWLIGLVLALIGFALLGKSRLWDMTWLIVLLAAKSVNGHAMGNEPLWLTVPLDFIHLLAASVWVGGLLLIVPAWNKHRAWVDGFLPAFSTGALISMLALAVTGFATTMIYLPGLNYLLYSQWGKLLIAKVVFVVIVVLLAIGIRLAMKQRKVKDQRDMIRMDFGAMGIIVVLVGLLTFVSPVPPNEPLYWHQMGEEIHMTVQVSPMVPGENQFRVDVWMAKELGKPKQVQLRMHNLDHEELAPIDVPLKEHKNEQQDAGFSADDTLIKTSYKADGPFIPFAGLWKIEFRILDKNDDETIYTQETRVY